MKKRILALILCFAMTAVLLAGCGGDQASQNNSNVKKDELTLAYSYKPPLDPFNYSTDITRNVMEPLIRFDRMRDEGIVPLLAETYESTEDGLTWTFHLRDAKFSDGTPVTANDVVYSLDYALSTPVGAGTYIGYAAEALDEKTVVFTVPYFSDNTAYYISTIPIVNSAKFESEGDEEYFKTLVGTGPYILESYDDTTGLAVITANPDYWGGQPQIKKITLRYIPDPNTALIALQRGDVDFTSIPPATYNQASKDSNLKIQFGKPTLGNYIIFNTEVAPFDNQKLRQAILYAIDTDGVAAMSEVKGNYVVPHCFYLPEWGMDKPAEFTEYTYNPDKAKELLEESGLELPVDLGEIGITSDQKAMWEAIQQNLAEVGITIKVSSLETSIWMENLWKGNFGIAAMSNLGMADAGYTNICDIFHSSGIEHGYNYSRFADPELDAYLEAAAYSPDYDVQNENFGKALNIINDQALWGTLYTYGRIYAMNKALNIDTTSTQLIFNEISWN